MKNVLVKPGKHKLTDGPDSVWIEQLEANINLVLKKYAGEPLISFEQGSKISKENFAEPLTIILLLHISYAASDDYLSFLKGLSDASGNSNHNYIRIDTSLQDTEKLPEAFTNAVSINMADPNAGENEWIGEESPVYWSRLLDLAAEISPIGKPEVKLSDAQGGDVVYLAQTAADMGTSRNILKRELMEHGYSILPSTDLKYHPIDLKSNIQSQVDKSRLTIHLLGNTYGETIKETGYSIAEVQIQYVTEYLEAIDNDPVHASKEINRLIWIDPEYNPLDSQQEDFINQLKRNIENLHRTEIIQTPLELFKTLVISRLRQKNTQSLRMSEGVQTGNQFIYLLHSPDVQEESNELANKLSKNGIKIGMLDYGKSQIELLKDHKRHLQECDGAIIYYGNSNRPWLNSKVMDLRKAPGMGRKNKLESMQVLAAKEDQLEDMHLPPDILIIREPDLSKAFNQLKKNLK